MPMDSQGTFGSPQNLFRALQQSNSTSFFYATTADGGEKHEIAL